MTTRCIHALATLGGKTSKPARVIRMYTACSPALAIFTLFLLPPRPSASLAPCFVYLVSQKPGRKLKIGWCEKTQPPISEEFAKVSEARPSSFIPCPKPFTVHACVSKFWCHQSQARNHLAPAEWECKLWLSAYCDYVLHLFECVTFPWSVGLCQIPY